MEDYCKDNRRNVRNQAKNDHFKGGKNKARRHKDTVIENERNSTQEAEISHLGFKIRNALKEQTLKIIFSASSCNYLLLSTLTLHYINHVFNNYLFNSTKF